MSAAPSPHARGLLLTAIGGLALSFDIPLIKLANGDVWSILLLRGAATFAAAIVIWLIWRALTPSSPPLIPGRAGLAVAACYGATSTFFIGAVYYTSAANLVFIVAFSTVFATAFSWLFLRERPALHTLIAIAVMIFAIGLIVRDGFSSGGWFGDLLAFGAAISIAAALVISRASGKDMGLTPLVAVVIPAAIGGFMVAGNGLTVEAPGWILFHGAVVIPVAFILLARGPRYLSGPEVAMFYLLETVLAPVWVWLIFSEAPSHQSLIGGSLLIAVLVAHCAWQVHAGRRLAQAQLLHQAA
jgi:drug/metabolite transporter (DMT)-like permease